MGAMNNKEPLVSIMIPNYNHSRYLDECITSALNQTYKNIEIVVLDNCSQDDSVKVISKYICKGVRVCRNTFNILNTSYRVLAQLTSGKYKMLLCADDYIAPDFIKRAVEIMEQNPNVGYVHGEREFVLENGDRIELDPFFRCSFVAPGITAMPIYMVTTIAHPSQGVFRDDVFKYIGGYDMEISHMNADKMLWFYLSAYSDYAYIKDTMSYIRIGNQTETFITQSNFQHPILCYATVKEMIRFAKKHKFEKVLERQQEAFERLAKDYINYAAGMLAINDKICARRYIDFIRTISENIYESELCNKLSEMCGEDAVIDMDYLRSITSDAIQKKRSYEPPEGYVCIDKEIL